MAISSQHPFKLIFSDPSFKSWRLPQIRFLTLFSSYPLHASQAVLPPTTNSLLFPQPNLPRSFFSLQTLKSNFPVDYIHLKMPTAGDSSSFPPNCIWSTCSTSHSLQNQKLSLYLYLSYIYSSSLTPNQMNKHFILSILTATVSPYYVFSCLKYYSSLITCVCLLHTVASDKIFIQMRANLTSSNFLTVSHHKDKRPEAGVFMG